jgi:predicted DNA-binding protein
MTTAKHARINARLPAEVARKVAYLESRTKMSTTEVVLESIERYYAAMTEGDGTAADALAKAGFIGCAKGPADLSRSYKTELTRSLAKKA